jgi:hypothetical protein
MADQAWTLAMVILANSISVIITLFSNRSGKLNKEIERLFEKTDKINAMERDLELFRDECRERHSRRKK